MLIGTFGPSTGWVDRTVIYDGQGFRVDGIGPTTPLAVLQYERDGHMTWDSDRARNLAVRLAGEQVEAQAPASQPSVPQAMMGSALPASSATHANSGFFTRIPVSLAIVVIAIAAGLAYWGISSAHHSWNQAAEQASGPGTSGGTPVTVFTWSGGGNGNDGRNSQPFNLQGGHQVFSISSAAGNAGYGLSPMLSFYIRTTDNSSQDPVMPPATGDQTSDLYLPAGTYYVASNTLDCTWSITITEDR